MQTLKVKFVFKQCLKKIGKKCCFVLSNDKVNFSLYILIFCDLLYIRRVFQSHPNLIICGATSLNVFHIVYRKRNMSQHKICFESDLLFNPIFCLSYT